MKIECEGVHSCWLTHYKKSGDYKIVFEEKPPGLIINGRLIEIRFSWLRHRGYYKAWCILPNVFFHRDELHDIFAGRTDNEVFPDANFYLEKAVGIIKGIVPTFPYLPGTEWLPVEETGGNS